MKVYGVSTVHIIPQLDYHLDLYLRPLKDNVVLVADEKSTEKMLQDICNAWVIGKVKGEFKGRNYCYEGNDYSLYNIGNIIEDALRDNYIVEFDGDDKTKTVIFNLINEDGKNVGTLEIFPDERYSAENYEDGFNWEDLNMKEIIKHFEDVLDYKIEYLKNDKRFDYSDRFWYKESKKSDKKSMKETISKSTWGDWIVDKVERVEGFYNGSPNVRPQLINNLIESIGLNANGHILTFDDIAEEITKGIRAYKLKDLDSWHVHLGHNNDGLRVDLNAKVEHFSEVINHNGKYTVVSVYFYVDEQGTNKEYDFGFVADVLVEINPYIDFVLEESKKSTKKSVKESVKPEIQLMVNNIIDELIGEYSSKEWDSLSAMEKWDIITRKHYSFGGKTKYVSEVRDLVIENMNHPFNVVFESKKSDSKSMKESFNSFFATSDMVGKGGKEWLLEGSYNFIMEFLSDWGIAPTEVEYKNGKDYFYDHDGNEYGFYTDEDGALISITDEGTNYAWKNNLNRISTKRVKVHEV